MRYMVITEDIINYNNTKMVQTTDHRQQTTDNRRCKKAFPQRRKRKIDRYCAIRYSVNYPQLMAGNKVKDGVQGMMIIYFAFELFCYYS